MTLSGYKSSLVTDMIVSWLSTLSDIQLLYYNGSASYKERKPPNRNTETLSVDTLNFVSVFLLTFLYVPSWEAEVFFSPCSRCRHVGWSQISGRYSPKYVILTRGIRVLSPNYTWKRVKYTFTLGSGPGHDLGTISETIKNPASGWIIAVDTVNCFHRELKYLLSPSERSTETERG